MLKYLKTTNVGPMPTMELTFGKRLNLLTGDNGLGKSFLLDIAWWALTRKWPAEINPTLTAGKKVLPVEMDQARVQALTKLIPGTRTVKVPPKEADIEFSFTGRSKKETYRSTYVRSDQAWTGRPGRPTNPGLVLYAMVDGSFAVWDPARNYWKTQDGVDVQDRPPAYVFSSTQIWNGLPEDGKLCNGLIRDWSSWQKENGEAYRNLLAVIKALSPSSNEPLLPGNLTRISLDDVRDMPTLKMPYGLDVPVVHASAGMRRIIALAYLLVWSWEEHKKASKLLDQETTSQIVFLIDEIEAHLHPKWQRQIVSALLNVMKTLTKKADVQVITATHSPLVLASVEPIFDRAHDAWFDFDFVAHNGTSKVELTPRAFIRRGDVSSWLTSDAFDLPSARSLEAEAVLNEAEMALKNPAFDAQKAKEIDAKLRTVLGETDTFWMRWRFVAEKKGWLE